MSKSKKKWNGWLRLFLSIFLILCFLIICFLAVKGYQKNKVPQTYTEEKIKQKLLQEHPEYGLQEENIVNVSISKSEDHKSFAALVEIEKEKTICVECYRVYYEFEYIDGSWVLKEGSDKLLRREPKWLLENTSWSVALDNGSEYRISFVTLTDAVVSVNEEKKSVTETTDNLQEGSFESNENDDQFSGITENSNMLKTSVTNQTCKLEQVGHELSYAGKIKRLDGTAITFLVDTERVAVDLGNGEGVLIMKKE